MNDTHLRYRPAMNPTAGARAAARIRTGLSRAVRAWAAARNATGTVPAAPTRTAAKPRATFPDALDLAVAVAGPPRRGTAIRVYYVYYVIRSRAVGRALALATATAALATATAALARPAARR
ncbi:hypothetical protein [Catenulispora subtropica]|uniref:Uncharacterized protein n=1 Tax=Catenulispora subtropica TaxID=450798 RepID=A0ABP5EAL0_9ACTN